MRRLLYILSILVLCLSCKKDIHKPTPEAEGVDLKFSISLSDFNMGIPEVTKAEEQIRTTDINSCAICLFKMDEVNPTNSRIVGYRIFINDADDTHKYFFKNLDNYTGDDNVTPLADVLLSEAGGIYNHEHDIEEGICTCSDDTVAAEDEEEYGKNGISADKKTVHAEFNYSHPLHGSVEKLRDGNYLAIALVNFHEEPIVAIHRTLGFWIKEQIKYWQDHQGDAGFDGIVYDPVFDGPENLIFAGSKQIINARVRLYDAVIESLASGENPSDINKPYMASHGDLIVSNSYIHNSTTSLCASTSQIIKVRSGKNTFNFDLIRLATRASFRINNIGTNTIKIEDFELSSNFGSAATYLFPVQGELSEHNSPSWLGRPVVSSEHAIVPFIANSEYVPGDKEVFFDALLASGYDETGTNPLSFDIRVSVDDGNVIESFVDPKHIYSHLVGDLAKSTWVVGTRKPFLIQTAHTYTPGIQLMLKSNGESTPQAYHNGTANAQTELDFVTDLVAKGTGNEYIWEFEKVSNKAIKIWNRSVGKYLKISSTVYSSSGHNLTYTEDGALATVFEIGQFIGNPPSSEQSWVSEGDRNGFKDSFALATNRNDGYKNEIFLNVLSNKNLVSLNKWADRGSHLYAYPVDHKSINQTFKTLTVPIQAYNQKTGVTTPLHELKRNDHLNVDINVSYSENSQDFTFSVDTWTEKNNSVRFD